jgi:uncharacterized protein YxjI
MVDNFERLHFKEKYWRGRLRTTFTDMDGNVVYRVRGSIFTLPRTYILMDADGKELVKIVLKLLRMTPKYQLIDLQTGAELGEVTQYFNFGDRLLEMTSKDGGYEIHGSFWTLEFDAIVRNKQAIIVKKTKKTFPDIYELTSSNELIERHIAASLLLVVRESRHLGPIANVLWWLWLIGPIYLWQRLF